MSDEKGLGDLMFLPCGCPRSHPPCEWHWPNWPDAGCVYYCPKHNVAVTLDDLFGREGANSTASQKDLDCNYATVWGTGDWMA